MTAGPSIRPSKFGSGKYTGVTERSATGDLDFWSGSYRTQTELEAVRLLWITCPALRPRLDAWVVDGAYRDLSCGSCRKRARVWRLDCRCRLLALEYAQRWLEEKFSYGPLYEALVEACRAELVSGESPAEFLSGDPTITDKSSARQTKRRSPSCELGSHTCILLGSKWSSWEVTRHAFEKLEHKYGLGGSDYGLVQLLHPALPRVSSLYVGPDLPEADWQRLEAEVVMTGRFTPLFHRLRIDWEAALRGMTDGERGFRESELDGIPLLTRRGIFYQPGMFPKQRAAKRDRREDGFKATPPAILGSGDPCPYCESGRLHSGGLHRDLGGWSGLIEGGAHQFED